MGIKESWESFNKARQTRYNLILDRIPWWGFVIVFSNFVLLVFVTVLLSALLGPQVYQYQSDQQKFSNASEPIISELTNVNNLNQEITVKISFQNALYVSESNVSSIARFGFVKNDFRYRIRIEAKRPSDDVYTAVLKAGELTYKRTLRCVQNSVQCDTISLSYQGFVGYSSYRYSVFLENLDELVEAGLIGPVVTLQYEFVTQDYSKFSIGWRYALLILQVPFAIFIALFLLIKQSPKVWHGEQFWVVLLLFFMTLYNNPIYILSYVVDSWVFPFINILFIATFFCFLLLTLLIISHSVIKQKKAFIWFYLPKVLLMAAIWLFVVIVLTFVRLQQKDDPAYDIAEQSSAAYIALALIAIALVVIYISLLVYYLLRAFFLLISRKLPKNLSARFAVVWIFTIAIIIATIVDVLIYIFRRDWNNAAQFLSYFVMYNLYAAILAIFYLPTWTALSAEQQKEEEQTIFQEEEIIQE